MKVTSHGLPEKEARPLDDRPVSGAATALRLDDLCPADVSLRYSTLIPCEWYRLFGELVRRGRRDLLFL